MRISSKITLGQHEQGRFALVIAAHHFLSEVIPFRDHGSRLALDAFVDAVQGLAIPSPDLDAVLLRCLAIINRHADQQVPSHKISTEECSKIDMLGAAATARRRRSPPRNSPRYRV